MALDLYVMHDAAFLLLPSAIEETRHSGEVREVETRGHGRSGIGQEVARHHVRFDVHLVQVIAAAVGLEGKHGVGARVVGGVLERDAEVVRQGVGFVGEDVVAELVVCPLPLRGFPIVRNWNVFKEAGRMQGRKRRRTYVVIAV